ncbi:Glycosyltransferase involved in cell wall bisynthesis [Pedobacter sp. ok626]|uniref:glycosyltransferase n=1 Tax=Pedobacter sp. ok626 TaxID=1761882 RepID=UPI00087ED9CA|nr:glycosyltransferase [Pedobacter sp. ok626]SDJ57118.1 Glycosyltransferase involved in cell wall bisynthesis [Pedobacter sp. ok626]
MAEPIKKFEKVTLLITHYNRSKSLERLLLTFSKGGCAFEEIIVSDDGSKAEHLDYIRQLQDRFAFTLLTTPKNRGLGNNINKGQDAVKTEYTLYVQEDFIPLEGFCANFENGLKIIESDLDVDSVRFYSYINYPKLKPFKYGFSEMIFDPWSLNLDKITMYSDHPHLRRSNFFEKFGRYSEIKSSDQTEYDMMISFLKKKNKAYFFADYKAIFEPINSSDEPSMVARNYWRNTDNFFVAIARRIYRQLKFNYRYFLCK